MANIIPPRLQDIWLPAGLDWNIREEDMNHRCYAVLRGFVPGVYDKYVLFILVWAAALMLF